MTPVIQENAPDPTDTAQYDAFRFQDTAGLTVEPRFIPNSTANQRYTFVRVAVRSDDSTKRGAEIASGSPGQIILPPATESFFDITTPERGQPGPIL